MDELIIPSYELDGPNSLKNITPEERRRHELLARERIEKDENYYKGREAFIKAISDSITKD